MSQPLLLIDSHYLCYRNSYAFGEKMYYRNDPTAILFGAMRDMIELAELFESHKFVFCFDYGLGKRFDMYPAYRCRRRQKKTFYTPSEKKNYESLQSQIAALRDHQLGELGIRNILKSDGYEGDDVIASVCYDKRHSKKQKIVISDDGDMLQLIGKKVNVWTFRTRKLICPKSLFDMHGVRADQWAMVKAIGGCKTDDVKGIDGVAEAGAIQYLKGDLSAESDKHKKITYEIERDDLDSVINQNLKVVELPLKGTPAFKIRKNRITPETWKATCRKYGIRSLASRFPFLEE